MVHCRIHGAWKVRYLKEEYWKQRYIGKITVWFLQNNNHGLVEDTLLKFPDSKSFQKTRSARKNTVQLFSKVNRPCFPRTLTVKKKHWWQKFCFLTSLRIVQILQDESGEVESFFKNHHVWTTAENSAKPRMWIPRGRTSMGIDHETAHPIPQFTNQMNF